MLYIHTASIDGCAKFLCYNFFVCEDIGEGFIINWIYVKVKLNYKIYGRKVFLQL